MLKRFLILLTALCMLFASVPAVAEEDDDIDDSELSQEELDELLRLDEVEDDAPAAVVGEVYHEMDREDFNKNSPAIYTCRILENSSIFKNRDLEGPKVAYNRKAVSADVLYVGSYWAIVRDGSDIGYVKRDRIYDVTPIDPVNTAPYGVQKAQYIARTADVCEVRKSMSDSDESWVVLNPGTRLSIWRIQDGWAIVHYWRTYGYINLHDLTDLVPVSPTDTPIDADTPIAAYTSFYTMDTSEINQSRIINISVACNRLTRVMQSGDSLNFNKQVGPYKAAYGYQRAWVLINGESKPGYGGGTCQVSSTLYNALLQLPGIRIDQRRPHGPSGAKYLPHGVDAAVGSDNLNLRFTNMYDFPIRVEGHSSGDGALLMLVYRAD